MAISYNVAVFFATIILGFLLAVIMEPIGTEFLDIAATHTNTQAATDGQQYVRYAWSSIHLLVIAAGAVQLIVAAVFKGRGVVR